MLIVKLKDIDLAVGSTDKGERFEEDLRTILSISTKDKRIIIEHPILGSSGNLLQDNGTVPVQISLEGEIHGQEASKTIRDLSRIYEAGDPVPFHSDLGAIAEVSKVKIENLQVNKAVGSAYHYGYRIDLKEDRG